MTPHMNVDTVGDFYIDDRGEIWKLVQYADRPTATLEQVDSYAQGEDGVPRIRINGVVGAPCFEHFQRLIPEDK